jgi:hypothetical protein
VEHFATRAAARARVSAWIEDYNKRRRHSARGMMSPAGYERGIAGRGSGLMPSLLRRPVSADGIWQLPRSGDRQDQPNRSIHAFSGIPKCFGTPTTAELPALLDLRLAADLARTDSRVTVTWPQI